MQQQIELAGGGTLKLHQDGPRVHIKAARPEDGRGLYKVWLKGASGERLLLGTLAPEGGALCLRRTLSVSELERSGCWPAMEAEAALVFPFSTAERWYCEQHPERLTSDGLVKAQIKGPMLCHKDKEGFRLAVPFRMDAPVALEALFCLGRVESLEGKPHLVWSFDRDGSPKIAHK